MNNANTDYQSMPDCTSLNHIPGDYGLPVIGKTIPLVMDTVSLVMSHVEKYGHVSRIQIGPHKSLLITHPNDIREILLDSKQRYSSKMGYLPIIGAFYEGTVLALDWDEHKMNRRVFQTAFKSDAMKGYVAMNNPIISQRIENWHDIADFRFYPHIKTLLLDTAARVFLGLEGGSVETDKISRAFLAIVEKGMTAIIRREIPGLPFLGFARAKAGQRYVEGFIESLIPVRRAGEGNDLMSMVVKEIDSDGNYWPNDVLIPQLSFLWFAAHDTTTSALNHLMMYLALPEYQHIQERLREFSLSLNKEFLNYDELEQLTDIDNCLMEALRLNPSIIMVPRRTVCETELGGHRIPAHTRLMMAPYYAHTDPDIWTNPHTFDPDRFSPERAEHKNHSFGLMSFGGGAHKCIGMHFAKMQTKLFLHQLLLRYRFSVPDNYAPRMRTVPLPKPADNLPLTFTRIA